MRVTWYTAASIDGRIAGPGDDLSFLDTIEGGHDADDFDRFISTVDALLLGSGTLRWLNQRGHDLPHHGLPTWLLTHDAELGARAAAADPEATPVTVVEGDVGAVIDAIAEAGHAHLWICGGGDVAGQALAIDRVDDIILTFAPVVLGAGPSIADAPAIPPHRFRLTEHRPYGGNAARLHWTRHRD